MTRSRSTRIWRRRVAVFTVGALALAACGGDDDATPDDSPTQDEGEPTDESADGEPAEEPSDDGEPAEEPATVEDENTEDGSPVVETLPPEEEGSDPVFGGTLRVGLEAESDGINPSTSALAASGWMMAVAVFDTLTVIGTDGTAIPYLAESYTPSEDFKSWTVKVREGIVFHDGEPLNADALIANFEAQLNAPLVGLAVKPFYPAEGTVVKIDDLTVQYNLLDSNASFPTVGSTQLGLIASPKWLAAAAADPTLNQEPVGTGPFVFNDRVIDSVTRFVRNEDWWGGDVYLDAVEFFPVDDSASRIELLVNGDFDALHTTDSASILDLRDDEAIQHLLDDSGEESFVMLNSEAPPFDDIRARQALANATPRQKYLDLIGLGALRGSDQRFIPESPNYNAAVKQVADDPDTAIALAAEYCAERGAEDNPVLGTTTCTDGKINIELQWSGPDVVDTRIADILDQGWSVAFNVTFDEISQPEHIQQTALGQFNADTWRQFGALNPSDDNVYVMCRTIGGISLNWPRFCDSERDALLEQAWASPDEAERSRLFQEVEQKINDAYTYVFLTHTLWDVAFADNVRGVCGRKGPGGEDLVCAVSGRTWLSSVWLS